MRREPRCFRNGAFTLLELLTVIVVIVILATMIAGSYLSIRDKARRSLCQNNLRNLHVAAVAYLTDHGGVWPQVPTDNILDPNYPISWVNAFQPYGMASINWICPSVQAVIGINYTRYPRLDYLPTPFNPSPRAANKYSTQPWFVERADIHGDGNLLIYANGQVKSMNEVLRDTQQQLAPE